VSLEFTLVGFQDLFREIVAGEERIYEVSGDLTLTHKPNNGGDNNEDVNAKFNNLYRRAFHFFFVPFVNILRANPKRASGSGVLPRLG
jgi:hypothetical protein